MAQLRAKTVEVAMMEAEQRRFSLDPEQWNAFVSALDRLVQPRPRLRRLFADPSVLEQLEQQAE